MWFGGWEETLCPVKAPANIVSLLQEKIVAENMAGKNWKKYMKAKRERSWVKKNLWKKEVVDMEKENIYGAVTWYQYASYIGQIFMSGLLGTITLFLQPKPNCHKKNCSRLDFFGFDFFLHFMRIFIFSLWGPLRKDRKIVFASGSTKISRKKPAQHIFTGMKIRFHQ